MEGRWDFLEWLGPDASTAVLMLLEDPADLVRVSAVSQSWRQFVIGNSFGKSLCLRIFPEVSNFAHVAEVSSSSKTTEVGSSAVAELENLGREHRVYLYLGHCLGSPKGKRDCINQAICASSTDNFPDESIENTLERSEIVDRRPSYWSSGGQRNPGVPESLTYRLVANICIIEEIKIQPFRAFFQYGHPIYSAKSENVLQSFKLPHPVICIGGILRIELLGRVQKQAMDDLYYICVCHVQVIGRPLSPALDLDIHEGTGSLVLKYFPHASSCKTSECTSTDEAGEPSSWRSFAVRLRHLRAVRRWNQAILSTLLGPIQFSDDDGDDDDYDDRLEEETSVYSAGAFERRSPPFLRAATRCPQWSIEGKASDMTTRITPGVGANLLGQHSAERNRDATTYVGNLDP
ncbi:F-box protein [Musa troglodytarum]|nr:F-box protein [Musa troglodytarum]